MTSGVPQQFNFDCYDFQLLVKSKNKLFILLNYPDKACQKRKHVLRLIALQNNDGAKILLSIFA